jgi:hypothetical protein
MNPIEIKQVDPAVRAELDPTATFPNEVSRNVSQVAK